MTTRTVLAAIIPAILAAPAFAGDAAPALTAEQAAEVRDIVKEVLADADQRAAMADGATAGIGKDGKIFLKSEDGKYDINLYGRVQTRFIYNNSANRGALKPAGGADTNTDTGFEVRRVNLGWKGHLGDAVSYLVELETRLPGADNTQVGLALGYADWELVDGLTLRGGKFYTPYSREAMISPYSQVAVERSIANNHFSLNKTQGFQLEYTDKAFFKSRTAVDNGGGNEGGQWNAAPNQYAVQSRIDFLPVGSFADVNDNMALVEADKQALLLGVAGYYQRGANNGTGTVPAASTAVAGGNGINYLTPSYNRATGAALLGEIDNSWGLTADALWKVANFSFYGAAYLAHAAPVNGTGNQVPTPWGLEGEVEYRINQQFSVYTQYNYINPGITNAGANNFNARPFQAALVGANYFITRNLKLTGDVVYVVSGGNTPTLGSLPSGQDLNTGAGLVNDVNGAHPKAAGEVAARLQLQVNF